MKLKKLEITGFKSFPEKTAIQFPPGISAIVGPNGCGKSNIVDALRWAMGEQSVKQLRGKSMEDIIFAGTNGKAPLNMAEVSLTLANDDGSVPEHLTDFTEIMITRRIYRSGETAYLVNKQPSRLKDIYNIFLGSGMGAKSYSIIQQGNIGAITDAGPDERRFFIEEAAGITRYKNRKNETLRKLEATNQNLLRVNDIISEVNRQMAALKRQARKAEAYKKHQEHIKKLDICLSLHYHQEYSNQIHKTDFALKSLRDTDIEHLSKIKKIEAVVEAVKIQQGEKNEHISKQKSQRFKLQRNIDRTENDLGHFRKETHQLDHDLIKAESELKELKEKNEAIGIEIKQVEKQAEHLKAKIETAHTTLDQESSASKDIKNQMNRLTQELDAKKADLMELMTQEARFKNMYQSATKNKENITRRLKRIDEEEIIAKKQVKELQNQEIQAKEEFNFSQTEINQLNKDIEAIRRQLQNKNKALVTQTRLVQTLELQRSKTHSEYKTLKKMEENFEWYKDGVKAIMKKCKNGENPQDLNSDFKFAQNGGVLGLMADIVEPKPSFETALEAALGESLQYILVNDQKIGLNCINYLQTHGAGRSGFIPVSSIKHIETYQQNPSSPAAALLNHVTIKPGYEKIAEAILGHVVVTTNIEEAAELCNGNNGFGTIVTKDGDMISHQSIMIGGSKENLSDILKKKQDLKRLESQIQALDQQLQSAYQEQERLESEVKCIKGELQKKIEQQNNASQNLVEAEKSLYKAEEDLKHALRHLDVISLEQEQLIGEKTDIDEEVIKYNQASAEIESRSKTAQEAISETTRKISFISSAIDNFNQTIVDLKLELTALKAQLESDHATLKRLKQFQDDGLNRQEQLTSEISLKNQKTTILKQRITDSEQTLASMHADLKQLKKTLEIDETQYHSVKMELKNNEQRISEIKIEREKTLEKIRSLEIKQSEANLKRENILNRIKDQYQRPLTEFNQEFDKTSGDGESLSKMSIEQMEDELSRSRKTIAAIENVNLGAIREYEELKDRFNFLETQRNDLVKAVEDLHKAINKINKITKKQFIDTLDLINEKMNEVFPCLFEGGSARLVLTEPDNPLETGVEFMIQPPGKKVTRMSLLSGGEKALAAISFIFSIFLIKPASFCLLDEIDAPLDDANVFRFNNLLKKIGQQSQIIMITHNKRSMEFADILFGVTMEKKGISKIVSVDLQR
ncbi:MAG: chromosome segregation protein SMC [Desulfobacterales bacterium]|nr:chromosome segregation protein SMC [Desulfobacterales bacterium]